MATWMARSLMRNLPRTEVETDLSIPTNAPGRNGLGQARSVARDQEGEGRNVGLQQDDQADDAGQDDAVPQDRLEDVCLSANLVCRCRGDDDALGIDHLPHDSTGAVGRADQHLGLVQTEMTERS